MTVWRSLVGLLVGVTWLSVSVVSGADYYCPSCATCQANVQFFGHYPTRWRPWPGESRPDIHFPQSIGAEPTKRPAGESRPELPKETLQPIIPTPRRPFPEPSPADTMPEPQGEAYPPPSAPMPPAVPSLNTATPPSPPPVPPAEAPPQMPPTSVPPATSLPLSPSPQPQPETGNLPGLMPSTPPPAQPMPPAGAAPNPMPAGSPGTSGVIISGPQLSGMPYSGQSVSSSTYSAPQISPMPPTPPWVIAGTNDLASRPSGKTTGTSGVAQSSKPGPLTIVNPTVVASTPTAPVDRPLPQNKLEISRSESIPDIAVAPWLPSVATSNYTPLPGKTPSISTHVAQGNPSTATFATPEPGPAVTVWAEDSAESRVTPAGFTVPSAKDATVANSPTAPVASVTANDVVPALNGYCPVELVENEAWVKGQARFAVEYQGKTYFCGGATQKRKFQTNPERYVPVCNGRDPVLLVDQGVLSEGKIEHCAVYDGRLYMFSSTASLARFRLNPQHYARTALQFQP
ncbi:MAG: hypothetical protein WBH86_16495 [Thermogutta sp.]|nr:hypothetical protein [Thermogutta sp.]HQF15109.1 hypothetical protein [Thermogutta sp.]